MYEPTPHDLKKAAKRWFGRAPEELSDHQIRVLKRTLTRQATTRNSNAAYDKQLTFGERLADRVAAFGGSWAFIISFLAFLAAWTGINLALSRAAFDPYPFIFLNLMLSMVAALQAPIIMMSQNRQSDKDRSDAAHDYEVNLKAEIEIMALHDKLDALRSQDIEAVLARQQEQLDLLTALVKAQKA